jgi:3-hydroxyisobutyrate dehydrogenase-like beta-hydroxyacid dehydrogenase
MAHNMLKAGYALIVPGIQAAPVSELCEFGARAAPPRHRKSLIRQTSSSPCFLPRRMSKPWSLVIRVMQGLERDSIYIDMSTIEPALTRKLAALLAELGVRMLDTPVSRGQPAALADTLSIMGGGDEATLEVCRPVLQTIGTDIFSCGPIGCGALMNVVNNLMAAIIVVAVCEGVVMGVKGGSLWRKFSRWCLRAQAKVSLWTSISLNSPSVATFGQASRPT